MWEHEPPRTGGFPGRQCILGANLPFAAPTVTRKPPSPRSCWHSVHTFFFYIFLLSIYFPPSVPLLGYSLSLHRGLRVMRGNHCDVYPQTKAMPRNTVKEKHGSSLLTSFRAKSMLKAAFLKTETQKMEYCSLSCNCPCASY